MLTIHSEAMQNYRFTNENFYKQISHRSWPLKTRALLRLERTMNLFGGMGEGWGREGRDGGREGREGRGGRGGRDDCYTYSSRYVQ